MQKLNKLLKNRINLLAWGMTIAVSVIAILAWGNNLGWQWSRGLSNVYFFFPVLGLLAFSLMWVHYMIWGVRIWTNADSSKTKTFMEYTRGLVLALILLHPGLLIFQLWRDGNGLPPASYKAYVGGGLVGFALLGTLALLLFLAFELEKWLKGKPIWRWILALNHLAMIMILVHGYKLGGAFNDTWFKVVWGIYALKLLAVYAYLFKKGKLV